MNKHVYMSIILLDFTYGITLNVLLYVDHSWNYKGWSIESPSSENYAITLVFSPQVKFSEKEFIA